MATVSKGRSAHQDDPRHLAVLIDADNAQPSVIEALLEEVARYGTASVKRIYGDFTSTRMTQWKESLLEHSIEPRQQFAYTRGKNATDSALIIDAMDLMYTRRFQGFCLVSSDSDFTRLAQRLREEGLMVYGFGEQKTPGPFVQACDKFIYTEVLRPELAPADAAAKPAAKAAASAKATAAQTTAASASNPDAAMQAATPTPTAKPAAVLPLPLELIRRAIEEAEDDEGWAHLGAMGNYLNRLRPDFDPRRYGKKKLSDLLRQHPRHFKVEERGVSGSGSTVLYVRVVE